MKTRLLRKLRKKYNWKFVNGQFYKIGYFGQNNVKTAYPIGGDTYTALTNILRYYDDMWSGYLRKYMQRRWKRDRVNEGKDIYNEINKNAES